MVRVNLDPRTGGICVQFMANKIFNIVLGYLQLILYALGFLTLLFSPSSVTSVFPDASTTMLVLTGFFLLLCVMFMVMLLIGLHKDKRVFVKTYCIFMALYTLTLILGSLFNLFVQPTKLGVSGFFLSLLTIIIHMVFVFWVRSYYLVTYCNDSNQINRNQP